MPRRPTRLPPFMPPRPTRVTPFHARGRHRCWRDIGFWRRHDRSRHWRRCRGRRGSRRRIWGARGDERQNGRDEYRLSWLYHRSLL